MKFIRIRRTPRFNVIYGKIMLIIAAVLSIGTAIMVIVQWQTETLPIMVAFALGFGAIGFATFIYGESSERQEQNFTKLLSRFELLTEQLANVEKSIKELSRRIK